MLNEKVEEKLPNSLLMQRIGEQPDESKNGFASRKIHRPTVLKFNAAC